MELVGDGDAGMGSLRRENDATHARIRATAYGLEFVVEIAIVTTLEDAQHEAERALTDRLTRALAREIN